MELTIENILTRTLVIPILTVDQVNVAVPLARALAAGGLNVIEITLRTDNALDAIERVHSEVPEVAVGAGTVLDTQDMKRAREAGARFAVSPGVTAELLAGAVRTGMPLLPGVATASEIMQVRSAGFTHAKFFPAEAAGGPAFLTALAGPFPDMRFCPTGGINAANFRDYLALPNVACVGGSWVAPPDAVRARNWQRVTAVAREAADGGRLARDRSG